MLNSMKLAQKMLAREGIYRVFNSKIDESVISFAITKYGRAKTLRIYVRRPYFRSRFQLFSCAVTPATTLRRKKALKELAKEALKYYFAQHTESELRYSMAEMAGACAKFICAYEVKCP